MPDETEGIEQSSAQLSHPITVPVKAFASADPITAQADCDGVGTCTLIPNPLTFPQPLTYVSQLRVQQEHATLA